MMKKKLGKTKVFKADTGGIYNQYPVTGASNMAPQQIKVAEDNTNYTQQYALKGASAGASLMAVNPVVGLIATGVGAAGGAIAGAIKENKAQGQNRDLARQAGTMQVGINKAWNTDSTNQAKIQDMTNAIAFKNSGTKSSFYGDYNARKGIKVTKASDGYDYDKPVSSSSQVDFGQEVGVGSNANTYAVPQTMSRKSSNFGNAGAYANAAMGVVGLAIDYGSKTTGHLYTAKNGMRMDKGGRLQPMSSDSAAIQGPSHENGGVDVTSVVNPQSNQDTKLEAEGGESMKDTPDATMIFSDTLKVPGTKMTFADVHKTISSKKGRMENKLTKYGERPGIDSKNAVKALSSKVSILNNQENTLFQIQQQLNGDHSNDDTSMARKGMKVIKAADGASFSNYANQGLNALGGALQYYNLENRVKNNRNARSQAVDQLAGLNIPTQKTIAPINLDYARTDVARAQAATQFKNVQNAIVGATSGNQVGAALTGAYGSYLDNNAQLLQQQENNRVGASNESKMQNIGIQQYNNGTAYQSAMTGLERDRDVINDRANVTTDYNSEHSQYVTDNFRKENYADKNLAYQYSALNSNDRNYLDSQGLGPNQWTNAATRALGSFKCGGKMRKYGYGGKVNKDCGCK